MRLRIFLFNETDQQQLQHWEDQERESVREGEHHRSWHFPPQSQVETDQNEAGSLGDLQGGNQEPEEHSPEERTSSEERKNI